MDQPLFLVVVLFSQAAQSTLESNLKQIYEGFCQKTTNSIQ